MKTCALLLGLVMLAGAIEVHPFPKHATSSSSSKSDCEDLVEDSLGHQKESVSRVVTDALLQLENRITALTESMQLQEERTTVLRDTLRLQDEKTATALQEVVRQVLQERDEATLRRALTALTDFMQLQEERMATVLRETLRLQDEKTATALQVVRQMLQERDEAALRRFTQDERLQRMEKGALPPCLERHDAAVAGGLASVQQLERRVAGLEAACSSLQPLSTAQAPPATPTTTTSSTTSDRPPAASAHHQQPERMRVEERMQETGARFKRAEEPASLLGQALRAAAREGSLQEVERLLEEGADVNFTSPFNGYTALMAAAASTSPFSSDVVSLLLRSGADVNAVDLVGNSALHLAARIGNDPVVPLLLGAGAEVDARREDGATPLHLAALTDQEAAARALLAGGARTDLKGSTWEFRDKTPFDIARSDALRNLLRP